MSRFVKMWNLLLVALLTAPTLYAQEAAAEGGAAAAEFDATKATSFANVVFGGGIVNLLCWIALFSISAATLALVIDGLLAVKRPKLLPAELVEGVRDSLNRGDLSSAMQTCEVNPSPLSRILLTAFANIEEGYEVIQEAVTSSAEMENEKLLQRVNYLNVCGQLGPMLGLLGTVVGMVMAFAGLASASGASRAAVLATAISTALWTTVVGLLVAIPALLAYTLLKNHATRIILEMEATVLDLIKVLRTAEVEQQ
ncbi:MAG: MotA/TolQ/ExbB proton channel family protein [Lentisphaeria bacterium]|jgi:biopolymer transport protein ExbB